MMISSVLLRRLLLEVFCFLPTMDQLHNTFLAFFRFRTHIWYMILSGTRYYIYLYTTKPSPISWNNNLTWLTVYTLTYRVWNGKILYYIICTNYRYRIGLINFTRCFYSSSRSNAYIIYPCKGLKSAVNANNIQGIIYCILYYTKTSSCSILLLMSHYQVQGHRHH